VVGGGCRSEWTNPRTVRQFHVVGHFGFGGYRLRNQAAAWWLSTSTVLSLYQSGKQRNGFVIRCCCTSIITARIVLSR
jgi:hypothetical protein